MAGVPVGRELGMMRGIVSAMLSFLNDTSVLVVPRDTDRQAIADTEEISARLSRIRFSEVMPPDREAEEHARLHQEEDGDELFVGQEREELELLEDMVEQMNTREVLRPEEGRPTAEDVQVLKNRLDQLAARLGMNINYA